MNTALVVLAGQRFSCAPAAVGNPQENSFWVSAADFRAGHLLFLDWFFVQPQQPQCHLALSLP
jgi:hypothetical protein